MDVPLCWTTTQLSTFAMYDYTQIHLSLLVLVDLPYISVALDDGEISLVPYLQHINIDSANSFINRDFFTLSLSMYPSVRQGPVRCDVHKLPCTAATSPCTTNYSGQKDNIHFWTNSTCAGDEVGWDFHNLMIRTCASSESFCDEVTRVYKSIHPMSAPFMCNATFLKWWSSWSAKMNVDNRQKEPLV